jgi:2-keto-4-pentenoate hydratase/2-oxohepta-3-ene-1,7-dioic acid hydratase in catechol pathway
MKFARIIDRAGEVILTVQGADGALYRCEGASLVDPASVRVTNEPVNVKRFLSPVDPRALVCVAASYRKHIEECNLTEQPEPVIFMKNPAAAQGHECPIVIPAVCGDEVDYEGELAVILSQDCHNVTQQQALERIAGYTVINDVSARIWQLERGGGQWVRGKSFNTFAPMGPFLVTPDEVGNPDDLKIKTVLNGETVQESSTKYMIRGIAELISFLSQGTTLLAGTVILTGTPEGVGWFRQPRKLLRPGSTISVEIEKVGILTNPVVAEE